MNDLLFWYTGATVWYIIFILLSISIFSGVVLGLMYGSLGVRRWVGLRIISKCISHEDMQFIRKTVPTTSTEEAKIIYAWLEKYHKILCDIENNRKNKKETP